MPPPPKVESKHKGETVVVQLRMSESSVPLKTEPKRDFQLKIEDIEVADVVSKDMQLKIQQLKERIESVKSNKDSEMSAFRRKESASVQSEHKKPRAVSSAKPTSSMQRAVSSKIEVPLRKEETPLRSSSKLK